MIFWGNVSQYRFLGGEVRGIGVDVMESGVYVSYISVCEVSSRNPFL